MKNRRIAPFPFGITVEVHRSMQVKHGDRTYVLSHTIAGCAMAPRYSNEVTDRRSAVIVGFSLYGPPGSDILAKDRIRTPDGNFYHVVGEAAEWTSPMTGWRPGFEAALERVT